MVRIELNFLDTGYISNNTLSSQTQLSDANRAGYTGSAVTAITVQAANVSFSEGSNTESRPVINTVTDSNTSFVSTENRTVTINAIKQKRIVTSGWSTNDIVQIMRLGRTRGLKLLYPDGTNDTDKTVVEAMGAENTALNFSSGSPSPDAGTVSTNTPYLIGRVKGITINDSSDGDYWRISFNFEISG